MRKFIFAIFLFCTVFIFAQKHDYNWIGSGDFKDSLPDQWSNGNKVFNIDFNHTPPAYIKLPDGYIEKLNKRIYFSVSGNTSYSDSNGKFVFASDGKYIYNSELEIMENGDTINPGKRWLGRKYAYDVPISIFPIPLPNSFDSIVYLFHTTLQEPSPTGGYYHIPKYSIIDTKANNGLGKVLQKNLLVYDESEKGLPMLLKHANGRDWWVMYLKATTSEYFKKLLTPNGLVDMGVQKTNQPVAPFNENFRIGYFSANGERFASLTNSILVADSFYARVLTTAWVDRCTGELYNFRLDTLPISKSLHKFLCFSPNAHYIYATDEYSELTIGHGGQLLQIDITKSPLKITIIADTLSLPGIPDTSCCFANPLLGPDGKIYVGTATQGKVMTVIDKPDLPYPDCGVKIHQITLPSILSGISLGNYPNYRLGPISGSPCDTIVATQQLLPIDHVLKLYPNPVSNTLTIELMGFQTHSHDFTIEIVDVLGRKVYSEVMLPYSVIAKVNTSALANGNYYVQVKDGVELKAVNHFVVIH